VTTVGIVTGAGRGMGAACATRLAEQVDALLLVDLDDAAVSDAATALARQHPVARMEALGLDITDRDGIARLASRVSELGTLRAVAHAAGISPTMADWRRVVTVDLVGTALLTDALHPLATTGTAIVCFASMAALLAADHLDPAADVVLDEPLHPDLLDRLRVEVGETIEDPGMAYAWAKRGVHRLVQREAVRFGRAGARICSVSPGIIDTPMGRQEYDAQEAMPILVQMTPLGREGRADEVAAVAAFLCSDEASFVNGIDVAVDGGVVAAVRSGAGGVPGDDRSS
jgi:NAD(P)-dependent dehydrogenase (short-subunit alcohol dehydrogenase family)